MESETQQIRRQALAQRRAIPDSARRNAARTIARRVLRSRDFARARRLGTYLSMPDEVDTSPIIAAAWRSGKLVYVPRIEDRGQMVFVALRRDSPLRRNALGIWEPVSGTAVVPEALDLVLLPLAAFDAANHRVGMGGGYYDRYFGFAASRHRSVPPRLVGLAFDEQRVDRIAARPWDVSLARVISNTT